VIHQLIGYYDYQYDAPHHCLFFKHIIEYSTDMPNLSLKKIQRFIYWILPVVILSFIFAKIDVYQLIDELTQVSLWGYLCALMCFPIMMLIGASRWKVLVKQHLQKSEKLSYLIRHYWIGMSIGFFMPASIGWDIYRIMLLAKKYGNYAANIVMILFEKLLALLVCMGMILLLYPFIDTYGLSPDIKGIIDIAFYLFLFCLLFLIILITSKNNHLLHKFTPLIEEKLKKGFFSIFAKVSKKNLNSNAIDWKELLTPFSNVNSFTFPILLSTFNIIMSGLAAHFFFEALNYDIPLLVNIFVAPIFFFIFILPISFGSIGIREGAYIFIYGLFGVPAETALIVSFFGLSGVLLNNMIGALLIYKKGTRKILEEQNQINT
jgi:uncharacterized protein (TIRG00374 family)